MDRVEVERKLQVAADRLATIDAEQAELATKRHDLIVSAANGDSKAEAAVIALDRQIHELQQGRTLQEQIGSVLREQLAEIERTDAAEREAARVQRLHEEALKKVELGERVQAAWDRLTAELEAYVEHNGTIKALAYGEGQPNWAAQPAGADVPVDAIVRRLDFIRRNDFRKLFQGEIAFNTWKLTKPFFAPGFDAESVKPAAAAAS